MSNLPKKHKVISRFEMGMTSELKDAMSNVQADMRKTREAIADFVISNGVGGLLKAMQSVPAANDAENVNPALKHLGQWVFEGRDQKWASAAINTDGRAYLHNMPKGMMYFNHDSYGWCSKRFELHEMQLIEGSFDPSGFAVGFIERQSVNDVEYLSETVPYIDESDLVEAMAEDGAHSGFIKSLASLLILRMHGMARFSEDDWRTGGQDLQPWDIVVCNYSDFFGVIVGQVCVDMIKPHTSQIISIRKHQRGLATHITNGETDWSNDSNERSWRTITQGELESFRHALEACYV